MLSRINASLTKEFSRLRSWIRRNHVISFSSGRCCFTLSSDELLIIYAQQVSGKLEIRLCERIAILPNTNVSTLLSSIVDKFNLKHTPCTWVLDSKEYQLFLMEELPVEATEFQAAIAWKMKGMLSYPVEEAVLDKFHMPEQKGINIQKMMTVVAARQDYLKPIVKLAQKSGLLLNVIEIPELDLRNITAYFETDEKSTALIYLQNKMGQLIITRRRELYLSRRIEFNLDALKTNPDDVNTHLEWLALELQRSFDYYQTQWRAQPPERIFLVAPTIGSISMSGLLTNFLGVTVNDLILPDILSSKTAISKEEIVPFLPLIGGLLREEISHASTD